MIVARSGSHNIWLNTSVPNNYAGTRFTNLINQNSTLKFTQKEGRYPLREFNFGFIIHSNDLFSIRKLLLANKFTI